MIKSESIEIKKYIKLGKNHPYTITCQKNLIALQQAMKKDNSVAGMKAESFIEKLKRFFKKR